MNLGAKKLIPIFRRVAKDSPFYKRILQERGIQVNSVKDEESFKRLVPIIDKSIFNNYDLQDLSIGGGLKEIKQVSISSGFSEKFSYSLTTSKELNDWCFFTDMLLDYSFNISRRKTFFINALGMGVKVYTSLPIADTSVRPDLVIALVKKLTSKYEQFIIICNTYFAKKIIEDGIEQGIDCKSLCINFIIGEDWFPENFRSYLAWILGIDFDRTGKGIIITNFGTCELGLSLFQESVENIRIRRLASQNEKLHDALFGKEIITPILFQFHPYQVFLEEIDGELIFTMLSQKALIPLIRYASGDKGRIYTYNSVKEILTKLNYQDYLPKLKLPLVSIMGRKGKSIELNNTSVTPEEIKTGLYSDFEVTSATTGYFRMSKQDSHLRLEVQLKEDRQLTEELRKQFYQAIAKYVKVDFQLQLYPYKDFPYGMGLIYENKFRYV